MSYFGEVPSKEDGTAAVSCIHSHLHVAELKHYKHYNTQYAVPGVNYLWGYLTCGLQAFFDLVFCLITE